LIDQLTVQKQQLNMLLGRDVLTEFEVSSAPEAEHFEADLVAARAKALDRRPEVREARLKVKQAEGDRRIKKSEFIPDVSLAFQYVSLKNFSNFLPQNYMNVGISVSWEIFDWGRKKHELNEKDLTIEQARNGVRDVESATLIEVNDKFSKLRQSRQLLRIAGLTQETAIENVRVMTNRYRLQVSLMKDVLQAQASLEQANYQYQQALVSFLTARAEFEKAIGEDK
jgi:outer membrane protein TolC